MSEPKQKKKGFLITQVRASFPDLVKPVAFEEGKPEKYGVTLLIPKSREKLINDIKRLVLAAKVEKWGSDKAKWPKLKVPTPLLDGDEKTDIDGYKGMWTMKATTMNKPVCVDMDKEQIAASEIYPGCYVNVGVKFGTFDYQKDGKSIARGVSCYLEVVQKDAKEGEKFGSSVDLNDYFEDTSNDDSEESNDDTTEDEEFDESLLD